MFGKIGLVLEFLDSFRQGKPNWKKLARLVTGISAAQVRGPAKDALSKMSAAARGVLAARCRDFASALDAGNFDAAAGVAAQALGDLKL